MEKQLNQEFFQMFDDVEDLRYDQMENAKNLSGCDPYGYAFEPVDSFSIDELTFTETGMKLCTEAEETFCLMRQYNRHSPLFAEMAQYLEKLLRQLGSFLITREVMKQRGLQILAPDALNIGRLRQMTAFVFRKAFKSYLESLGSFSFHGEILNISMRYAALDKRLFATDEKIRRIREGKLTVDVMPGSAKPKIQKPAKEADETPKALPSKTAALPVNKAAVRDMEKRVPEPFPSEESAPAMETAAEGPAAPDVDAETTDSVLPDEPGSDDAPFAEPQNSGAPEELSPDFDENSELINDFFEDIRGFSPFLFEYSSA